MEDPACSTTAPENWGDEFSQTLAQQRRRVEEFLAAQRARLEQAHTDLTQQVQQVCDELDDNRAQTAQTREELEQRRDELARQAENLARLQEEIQTRQAEWEKAQERATEYFNTLAGQVHSQQDNLDRRQKDLQQRQAELDAAAARVHHDQQEFSLLQEQHKADAEHVAQMRQRLEASLTELNAQRERLAAERAETEAQRRRIAQELKVQRAAHLKELDRRRAELENLGTGQLGHFQRRIEEQDRRLEQQAADLESARKRQTELVAELESVRQHEAELSAQLEVVRRRQAELGAELEAARSQRQELDAELEAARGREASSETDLKAARARQTNLTAELEAGRQREAELAARLEGMRTRQAELCRELDEVRQAQADLERSRQRETALNAELQSYRGRQTELEAEVDSLRQQCGQFQQQAAAKTTSREASREELLGIQAERDTLAQRLAEKENRLTALVARLSEMEGQLAEARRTPAAGDDEESPEDLRRRYDMALEDLRELKARNQDLEKQLAKARQGIPPAARSSGGALDWEAEKRRILAALESDLEENDEEAKAERLKIEDVIRATDRVVAEKDREIQDLKQLLENQSKSLGSMAVGASALGEMLDKDAIVQEERANLRRLQQAWEEKLRQAEIEISIERAKIARERAELEQKLHSPGGHPSRAAHDPKPEPPSEKSVGGRWLSRLGLKDPGKQ